MVPYLVSRLASSFFVLFGVSVLVFSMMHLLPGDPITALMGEDTRASSPEDIQRIRESLGLNDPLHIQYLRFAGGAVQGDLGESLTSSIPVSQLILEQLPATLKLTIAGMVVAVTLGVILGVIAAVQHNRWPDTTGMFVALLGVSMPSFWLGLLLVFFFSFHLGWFPATGAGDWKALVLPAVTLGTSASAIIARLTRSTLLEVMRQEYIKTARAKGLTDRIVVLKHAMKNALIPIVTVMGLQIGNLLGGAVVVETVFSRPGIGRVAVAAISGKDFPLVQGTVLFVAVMYILVNLLVDLSYAWIDPRIRYQ